MPLVFKARPCHGAAVHREKREILAPIARLRPTPVGAMRSPRREGQGGVPQALRRRAQAHRALPFGPVQLQAAARQGIHAGGAQGAQRVHGRASMRASRRRSRCRGGGHLGGGPSSATQQERRAARLSSSSRRRRRCESRGRMAMPRVVVGPQEAGIPAKFAPTIGIAVDHRRKNRSLESLQVRLQHRKGHGGGEAGQGRRRPRAACRAPGGVALTRAQLGQCQGVWAAQALCALPSCVGAGERGAAQGVPQQRGDLPAQRQEAQGAQQQGAGSHCAVRLGRALSTALQRRETAARRSAEEHTAGKRSDWQPGQNGGRGTACRGRSRHGLQSGGGAAQGSPARRDAGPPGGGAAQRMRA